MTTETDITETIEAVAPNTTIVNPTGNPGTDAPQTVIRTYDRPRNATVVVEAVREDTIACPVCHQPQRRSGPASAYGDNGAPSGDTDYMHTCGQIHLRPPSAVVYIDTADTEADVEESIEQLLADLAAEVEADIADRAARTEAEVRETLDDALRQLARGGEPGGSETEPGAYVDGDTVVAWADHPAGSGLTITATAPLPRS